MKTSELNLYMAMDRYGQEHRLETPRYVTLAVVVHPRKDQSDIKHSTVLGWFQTEAFALDCAKERQGRGYTVDLVKAIPITREWYDRITPVALKIRQRTFNSELV